MEHITRRLHRGQKGKLIFVEKDLGSGFQFAAKRFVIKSSRDGGKVSGKLSHRQARKAESCPSIGGAKSVRTKVPGKGSAADNRNQNRNSNQNEILPLRYHRPANAANNS